MRTHISHSSHFSGGVKIKKEESKKLKTHPTNSRKGKKELIVRPHLKLVGATSQSLNGKDFILLLQLSRFFWLLSCSSAVD